MAKKEDLKEKMMELNYYDKDDNPRYGWDVYVQRMYVFPWLLFPISTHVLSPEACLRDMYSVDVFQGSLYSPQTSETDSEILIQLLLYTTQGDCAGNVQLSEYRKSIPRGQE